MIEWIVFLLRQKSPSTLSRKIEKKDMQVILSPTSSGSDSKRVNEGLFREKNKQNGKYFLLVEHSHYVSVDCWLYVQNSVIL